MAGQNEPTLLGYPIVIDESIVTPDIVFGRPIRRRSWYCDIWVTQELLRDPIALGWLLWSPSNAPEGATDVVVTRVTVPTRLQVPGVDSTLMRVRGTAYLDAEMELF